MEKYLEMLNELIAEIGNVPLETAKNWVEGKANAEDLRAEGHEEAAE